MKHGDVVKPKHGNDFDCLHSGVLSSAYLDVGNKEWCTEYDLDLHNLLAGQLEVGPARYIGWRARGLCPRNWLP